MGQIETGAAGLDGSISKKQFLTDGTSVSA